MNLLHSETIGKLEPVLSEPSLTFDQSKESCVIVNTEPERKVEQIIDDTVCVRLYKKYNWFNLESCVTLIILTMARPLYKNGTTLRPDLLESIKLTAKGKLEELNITMGWKLDTRIFPINSPEYKFQECTDGIR